MMFNIAFDVLAILIAQAKEDGQVGSRIPHLVEEGGAKEDGQVGSRIPHLVEKGVSIL
jgi:hypothetical protein